MIKAIIFDAGDILYRRRRNSPLLPSFLARFGLQPPDYADEALQQARQAAFLGEIRRDEFFDKVLAQCGLDPRHFEDGRKVLDAAQAAIDFVPNVAKVLHHLKQAGFRLGIATNTFEPTSIKLGWFMPAGIADIWDSFATSCELGLVKPNPGIYFAAIAPLDVYPDEAAFVGHAEAEIAGARRLGFKTVAFNRDHDGIVADRTIASLEELAPF